MATTDPAALFPLSRGTGRILPCPRRCPLAPCLILTSAAPAKWGRKAGAVPQSHQSPPSPTAWPWIPPGGHLSPYRTKTCTPPRAAPSKTSLLVPAPLGPTALPRSARTPPVPPHSPWCRKGLPAALWGGSAALNLLLPPLSLPPNLSFRLGMNQNLGGKGRSCKPPPQPPRAVSEGKGPSLAPQPRSQKGPEMQPLRTQGRAPVLGRFAPLPRGALPSRESGRAWGCCISRHLSARSRRAAASTGSHRSPLLPAEPPRTGMENWAQRGAARGCWWPRAGGQREAQR